MRSLAIGLILTTGSLLVLALASVVWRSVPGPGGGPAGAPSSRRPSRCGAGPQRSA